MELIAYILVTMMLITAFLAFVFFLIILATEIKKDITDKKIQRKQKKSKNTPKIKKQDLKVFLKENRN